MIFLMEESRNEAIKHFDKAIAYFKEVQSIHGQASSYYMKALAIMIHDYIDEYNNANSNVESKQVAEKSMMMYKLLKHKEGFIKTENLCISSEPPPNKVTKVTQIENINYIPYVEFDSNYEFVTLGIEPILTVQFESSIDTKSLKNLNSTKNKFSKQLKRTNFYRTNKFKDEDSKSDIVNKSLNNSQNKNISHSKSAQKNNETKARIMSEILKLSIMLPSSDYFKMNKELPRSSTNTKHKKEQKPSSTKNSQKEVDLMKLSEPQLAKNYSSVKHPGKKAKYQSIIKNSEPTNKDILDRKKMIQDKYTIKNSPLKLSHAKSGSKLSNLENHTVSEGTDGYPKLDGMSLENMKSVQNKMSYGFLRGTYTSKSKQRKPVMTNERYSDHALGSQKSSKLKIVNKKNIKTNRNQVHKLDFLDRFSLYTNRRVKEYTTLHSALKPLENDEPFNISSLVKTPNAKPKIKANKSAILETAKNE